MFKILDYGQLDKVLSSFRLLVEFELCLCKAQAQSRVQTQTEDLGPQKMEEDQQATV